MNIENYIKMLFSDQEIVIVPELGAFLVSTDETTNKKDIKFNPDLTVNDGLLAGIISRYESITEEEALLKIENFVAKILKEVSNNKSYEIEEFGKFYYDWKNSIGFDIAEDIEIATSEAEEENTTVAENTESITDETTEEAEEEQKEKKSSILTPILYVTIPLIIIGTLGFFIFTGKIDVSKIFEKKAVAEEVEEETEEASEEETTTETESTPAPVTAPAPVAKASSSVSSGSADKGRYYVIAAGFSSEENASKFAKTVSGDNIKVLAPSSNNLYRVSLADYDNFKDANAKVQELNANYNNSLWVHKSF
jgi:flagellar basal body-associated protein FliL/nucleoid DNA-binding protein